MTPRFVRVVHRAEWEVELVDLGQTLNFPTRAAALAAAVERQPDWIEVGEIVPATAGAPQHHRWKTLRRDASGEYVESGLDWADRHQHPD